MAFGDVIRFRREKVGLDQASLARRIGVTQQTISRWERSPRLPPAHHFLSLASALDVAPTELLATLGYVREDDPPPTTVSEMVASLAHVDTPTLVQLAAEALALIQARSKAD